MVAQMAEIKKFRVQSPPRFNETLLQKYTAYLFRIFVADDHDIWYDRMHIEGWPLLRVHPSYIEGSAVLRC